MASGNSFGLGSQQFPLYDPRLARAHRERFKRDFIPKLQLANSFYAVNGLHPCRGWLLMRREDYNNIPTYSTGLSLVLNDLLPQTPPFTLNNLSIVQARCVTRGLASDDDALYLVEITDRQGVLWNQWFKFPTDSSYNVRAPAYPETFYSLTLNGGSPWTWSQMIGDLWGQMAGFLGPFPGLPVTPAGIPENFTYPGCSCWEALNQALELIGCTVGVDLTNVNTPYTVVSGGSPDPIFAANTAKYANFIEDDFEWISSGAGRVPGNVTVYFHRRNQYYGTEETVRSDALQWATTAVYGINVPAPAPFNAAPGSHVLYDDFTVKFDANGNPLAADVATANTIATERVQQYFNVIFRATLGSLRQVYTGLIPFATGSQLDGVCWRQQHQGSRSAWQTEIRRGMMGLWPEVVEEVIDAY